jgi:lysophospholipase L1-like esterase
VPALVRKQERARRERSLHDVAADEERVNGGANAALHCSGRSGHQSVDYDLAPMLRRSSLLLLLVPLALAGVGVGSGSTASSQGVWLVGDSLAKGAAPYLPEYLPGWSVSETAVVGLHLSQGLAAIRARASTMPGHVVVSLGTNDDPRNVGGFRQGIRAVLAAAGPDRCVVWPNIVRPRTLGTTYDGYNRALRAEAAAHANLRVIDWVSVVRAHPGWLRSDGVHLTAEGYSARAGAMAHALRSC